MNSETKKDLQSPAVLHDFELDAEEVGTSVRMMCIEADPEGGVFYQFGRRQPRCLQLPSACGLRAFGMIDQIHVASFFDLKTNALQALAAFSAVGTRVFLFGRDWGAWLDEDGRRHVAPDAAALLRQCRVPVALQEFKRHLMLDFTINIYARQLFHHDMRCFFREERGLRHGVSLVFQYPEGQFITSRLVVHDVASGKLRYIYDVDRFPLLWPERKVTLKDLVLADLRLAPKSEPVDEHPLAVQAPLVGGHSNGGQQPELHREPQPESRTEPQPEPRTEPQPEPRTEPPVEPQPPPDAEAAPQPPAHPARPYRPRVTAPPPPRSRVVVPETTHLSVHALIAFLSTEGHPEHRWLMIEPNLGMGRPERTYALISHHADLIADRVRGWPPVRLKAVFADQPGAVLIGLMLHWKINQVLAVADANAEADRIIEWLREREIDRLLNLEISRRITSVNAARRVLNLDVNADLAAVRKTWRTLLGFLNVDHGRASERAIHRKKDEIAKHLQDARDVLMQKLS